MDWIRLGVDYTALDDLEDCPWSAALAIWKIGRGFSKISVGVVMALEMWANDSEEPSIRSSWRKRSPEVSPNIEEHEARNLVTFEVRTTPFPRLSM